MLDLILFVTRIAGFFFKRGKIFKPIDFLELEDLFMDLDTSSSPDNNLSPQLSESGVFVIVVANINKPVLEGI